MAVAYVLKRSGSGTRFQSLMLELPAYHWPNLRNLLHRPVAARRDFPEPRRHHHPRADGDPVGLELLPGAAAGRRRVPRSSTASRGTSAAWLAVLFAPIGFNWQISIALVPGLAAREVAVGALGTVYALSATGADVSGALTPLIAQSWSLPTALVAARLVRVRAAVPVDPGHGQARDEFLALSAHDGRLSVRAGLCGLVCHLPIALVAVMKTVLDDGWWVSRSWRAWRMPLTLAPRASRRSWPALARGRWRRARRSPTALRRAARGSGGRRTSRGGCGGCDGCGDPRKTGRRPPSARAAVPRSANDASRRGTAARACRGTPRAFGEVRGVPRVGLRHRFDAPVVPTASPRAAD